MTPLSRAIVGSRRSYGTLPNTSPCQVRRCFGKRSSRTTLAISSPKPITRIRSIATFLVLCSPFINVFLLQRPGSLPHLPVPLTSQIQRWLRRWRSTRALLRQPAELLGQCSDDALGAADVTQP